MGKPTGFLEYIRTELPCKDVHTRIQGYQEFHTELTEQQKEEQAARCMNCGVPFCQSEYGCPLHNLIPEWNDEVYTGNWKHAWSRLIKTNNFPEFTGRVCPAICESACTCGIYDEPVTIRNTELAVIEEAWKQGLMRPQPPEVRSGKKVAVIGSGPAGLAAADQLNQRGHLVTVYEKDEQPGGLLMYGIPNMKLDKSVIERRIGKMKAEGIEFITSAEIGKDISGKQIRNDYDAVILCCGARRPRTLAADAGECQGVLQALAYLTAATEGIFKGGPNPYDAKGKKVVIIGNGDTATDCVATAVRQGAASILQLVRRPRAEYKGRQWPYFDAGNRMEYGQEEAAVIYGQDPRLYKTTVKEMHRDKNGKLNGITILTGEKERKIQADMLILALGFSGAEPGPAESLGITLNKKGLLGEADHRTEDPKIFACGDMRQGASLVVKAIADGRACARAVDEYLEGYSNM